MPRTLIAVLSGVLTLTLLMSACGSEEQRAGPDHYTGEDDSILVTCERSGETEFGVAALMEMDPVTGDIVRETDDGREEYEVRGVPFSGVLASVGGKLEDLDGIRLVAGDGYSVSVPRDIVIGETIILAYEIRGEPLDEKIRPIRVFIPGQESMYWVRNLVEIELLYPEERSAEIEKIVFLETRVFGLEVVDYEDGDLAVRTADLLAGIAPSDAVHMTAADGFTKAEDYDIFIDAFIKVTGADAPAFRSPDLPRGMHVRDLVWFSTGSTALFSVTRGLEALDPVSVAGETGASLVELAGELGLAAAETYLLEAVDGYTVEVSQGDLDLGIVYVRDSGEVAAVFEGLPRSTAVRGLLSLKVVE